MTDSPDKRAVAPPWRVRLATTLAAWLAAYLVVLMLYDVLGTSWVRCRLRSVR
jgi:hypothetical protein